MEEYYKKSKGNAGLDGVQFQVGLSTVIMLNALRNLKHWKISTEDEAAGKFDDVVLHLSNGSTILLQAKHKDCKRINKDQLLSDNSKNADFSLPKYFLSYQELKSRFTVKNIIICTNADMDKTKMKDVLAIHSASSDCILHDDDCTFVTFNKSVLSDLRKSSEVYYDRNMKSKGIDKGVITDENLKDFLDKLQFLSNYPSGLDLNKKIDRLLSQMTDSKLWQNVSAQEIYKKMEEWFKHPRGEYLNETRAIAMFCEIKSDKYCKRLQAYQLLFLCNSLNFTEDKRIFHIQVEAAGCLIQVLKVYDVLQEKKTLYADFEDGVQKQMVEAFGLHHYAFLVLICSKSDQNISGDVADTLKETLNKSTYKKVVLIGRKQLTQQLGEGHDVIGVNSSVAFDELTEDTRQRLVKRKSIKFQGEDISLEELLDTSTEDFVKIINSETLEKLLSGEMMKIGSKPAGLDEDTVRYYIERFIERETSEMDDVMMSYKKKKEVVTEANIFDVPEKVMLISDSAGMGKSTILAKLAVDMKKRNTHFWIMCVELNNYTRILRDYLRKKKQSIKITELLNSNDATKFSSHLETVLFAMDEKIVLMLDGFDEISPDYTELILNLLRECRDANNFAKVIVTTRPHMSTELEETLQVKPFVLRPFSKDNQASFLTNYWTHNLELGDVSRERCEKYAVVLISKISSWINQENSFAAIPLQVRMIAEIFEENSRWDCLTEWQGCKEFLEEQECEPKLPERVKLTELYDMFIEKKLEIYIDKVNPTGTAMGNSFDALYDMYFANHQGLAIDIILGGSKELDIKNTELFSRYRYDATMETAMLKIGIVQKINGDITFVHRTFAEYFVAKCILEVSELQNKSFSVDLDLQRFFIDELLCNPEFTVIRAFLESVLDDLVDALPFDIFKKYQSLTTCNASSWKHRSKLIHLLCGEGCLAILRLILKCIDFKVNRDKKEMYIMESGTEEDSNTLTCLKRLTDCCGIDIKGEDGNTPLHLAAQRGTLDLVRFLVEQGANVKTRNNNNTTALYSAARSGHLDVLEFLIDSGIEDVESKDVKGNTALQASAQRGHLDVVKFLVQHCADVNYRNDEGFTALHGAATEGHLEVMKFLVANGADVNLVNKYGSIPLHAAACNGHLDSVVYLVGCGVDVNATVVNGSTPIFSAVYGGFLDTVRFIQSVGGDIHVTENEGMSLLHMAALKGYTDIFKFLLDCGVDLNVKDNKGFTALHGAAAKGHLQMLEYLLDRGMYVDIENNCKSTPLHLAALNGQADTVKFLVQRGANIRARNTHEEGFGGLHLAAGNGHVNVKSNRGILPMHLAAENGHTNVVDVFKELGVSADAQDDKGFTVLHVASQSRQLQTVKYLVEHGADVNIKNAFGSPALHLAASKNYPEVVEILATHSADINVVCNAGFNALHAAAAAGHLDTVRCLLKYNADTNIASENGMIPLHLAVQYGHFDVVQLLVEQGVEFNDYIALHTAARNGYLNVVNVLFGAGVDLSARDQKGCTALHFASSKGHLDIVKYFVEHGVDVNTGNSDGFTALHTAAQMNHMRVVQFLLEHGAIINMQNKRGSTCVHTASSSGNVKVVEFLKQQGADVNVKDKNCMTGLNYATQNGHLDTVKYLVKCGVDLNDGDGDGWSPLHKATQNGHFDIVKFLVEQGVDLNSKTSKGFSALHSASKMGRLSFVEYFLGCGLEVDVRSKDGITPLHLAAMEGHLDVLRFLVEAGADLTIKDNYGKTVLDVAVGNGHTEVVEYFKE